MKTIALAAAVSATVIGMTPAAAEMAAHNWSGFYAGAFAGASNSASDWNGLDGSEGLGSQYAIEQSFDSKDGVFGGYLGFSIQQNNVVLGFEADYGRLPDLALDRDTGTNRQDGNFGRRQGRFLMHVTWPISSERGH